MSDVEGWFKRQQQTERQKQELARIGFPDLDAQRESWARSMKPGERQAVTPETPWSVNYRHGTDGGFEVTLTADDKFRVKPMNRKQLASLIHHLTGLQASEIDK